MLKAYVAGQVALNKFKTAIADLRKDEEGAALIEYSLLIGLIVVGAVAAMVPVGTFVGAKWSALQTAVAGK